MSAEYPRHVLISSMKNEGPFVLEWVAHHLVLGFDKIIIASNDCDDGSDQLLAKLDRAGYISHVPNIVEKGQIPQHAGYAAIRKRHDIDAAEWLMVLDADEFLNVHVGNHRVGDLTDRAASDVDVIALNGMFFSAVPEIRWRPERVCRLFQQRIVIRHRANAALKCLTRHPARFRTIHNHSLIAPKQKAPLKVLWADGRCSETDPSLGLWKQLRNTKMKEVSHQLAQYNHYGIKTWDSFMLRRLRGNGAIAEARTELERHSEAYFVERNRAKATDASIQRYEAEVCAKMDEFLTDGKIARWQRRVEAIYAERALKAAELYGAAIGALAVEQGRGVL